MYVGAASQHVLRMSFVPEQEAKNFDTQVTAFWSQLIQRDATYPLFLAIGCPNNYGCHPIPRHRQPFHLRTKSPCSACSIANNTLATTKLPTSSSHLAQPSAKAPLSRSLSPPSRASLHPPWTEPSSSSNLRWTLELTSRNPTVKPTTLRTAFFVCQWPKDLCCRILQPLTSQVLLWHAPREELGQLCGKHVDVQQHHCYGWR